MNTWYTKSIPAVLEALRTAETGLTEDEARRRLQEAGPNTLPEPEVESYVAIFLRQFKSPLIYILFAAALCVYWLGDTADSLVILAVLLFNAVVGAIQEGRAQNTLRALRSFSETTATVLRLAGKGGSAEEKIISDAGVVPGDIIILREGEKVPADARVIVARNLATDEAALTGESEPVVKGTAPLLKPDLPVAEQKAMVFKGTHIVAGFGHAVVVATGSRTEIGAIAREISGVKDEIPLQRDIRKLSRVIIGVVVAMSVILFFIGRAIGHSAQEMFATVVTLSVSVIPEGLPVVMTIVLATGVWRMSKRNALVKRLQAVEALGQARVIATDKTGTITKNEMVVQRVYAGGETYDVSGVGYEPEGAVHKDGVRIAASEHADLLEAARIAALAASARIIYSEEERRWSVAGDPTEAALQVFARKAQLSRDELEAEHPLLAEIPFDSSRKYKAMLHKDKRGGRLSVVGAPEVVLTLSSSVVRAGKKMALTKAMREEIEGTIQHFSRQGLRVVALARANAAATNTLAENDIHGLTFVALIGMKDGLREGVHDALAQARDAGLRVVMITGDHAVTARAIAQEAGIFKVGEKTLTGDEIDSLSDEELARAVERVSVFARVTPAHKLRIVSAYKARGEIIAMTGDGVNDAPSLVAADLGVGMGKIGTEVAKEASDIVLLDDNFYSIVAAIEEGRNIYKTIKKVILYLFSTSVGEVLTIAGALFVSLPLPLLPAQIIWLNLVTDGFLTIALGMEPKDQNLLSEEFGKAERSLVDRLTFTRMVVMGVPMALGTLFLFSLYLDDMAKALTVSLTALAVFQWVNAWNCRSEKESVFTTNPISNIYLVAALFVVIALQLVAVYNPFAQTLLHTTALTWFDWLLIVPVAFTVLFAEEARKWITRRVDSIAIPGVLARS
ncbi:MAG TPA: HAD-IC family P-type ATPase [Candidatus Paceibacterota bacterium]|nr:HAD-IC family P-type ATPase [Candidatus Paceibacterota bacterium]